MKYPNTLINNFIKPDEAEELLHKGMVMENIENQ